MVSTENESRFVGDLRRRHPIDDPQNHDVAVRCPATPNAHPLVSSYGAVASRRTAPVSLRGTILIVDDEPDVREVLEEYLVAHGYAAIGAENANAAKSVVAKHPVDLALVDI